MSLDQAVSNPNGLHRPFSRGKNANLTAWLEVVSNPNGLHRPFSRAVIETMQKAGIVSNPNGLHRPFSLYIQQDTPLKTCVFQTQTGSTGHLALLEFIELLL